MYWLCYDHPTCAAIIYAGSAPENYTHVYGHETEAEAVEARNDVLAEYDAERGE